MGKKHAGKPASHGRSSIFRVHSSFAHCLCSLCARGSWLFFLHATGQDRIIVTPGGLWVPRTSLFLALNSDRPSFLIITQCYGSMINNESFILLSLCLTFLLLSVSFATSHHLRRTVRFTANVCRGVGDEQLNYQLRNKVTTRNAARFFYSF